MASDRHKDILDRPFARSFIDDPTVPIPNAEAMRRTGSTERLDFLQVGLIILDNIRTLCAPPPDAAIFDVGCGWGRLALPLSRDMAPGGRYVGLDVSREAILWCRRNIAARHPHFAFHWRDIRNSYANPRGLSADDQARLAEEGEMFDLIVASSLFTHMLPDGLERYLAEMARCCRAGGSVYATFFLLDEESRALCDAGRGSHRFPHESGVARISDPDIPEDAVAYPLEHVLGLFHRHGFDARHHPGTWCGRADGFDYQDVLVATRR